LPRLFGAHQGTAGGDNARHQAILRDPCRRQRRRVRCLAPACRSNLKCSRGMSFPAFRQRRMTYDLLCVRPLIGCVSQGKDDDEGQDWQLGVLARLAGHAARLAPAGSNPGLEATYTEHSFITSVVRKNRSKSRTRNHRDRHSLIIVI
jgi:hypothetical protein